MSRLRFHVTKLQSQINYQRNVSKVLSNDRASIIETVATNEDCINYITNVTINFTEKEDAV